MQSESDARDSSQGTEGDLASRECVPCRGGIPPLAGNRLKAIAQELGGDWRLVDEHHLEQEFRFKNFRQAMEFANKIGEIAEQQGHHPELLIGWGKVKVILYTHKIDGLHENDFIMAAKIQVIPRG